MRNKNEIKISLHQFNLSNYSAYCNQPKCTENFSNIENSIALINNGEKSCVTVVEQEQSCIKFPFSVNQKSTQVMGIMETSIGQVNKYKLLLRKKDGIYSYDTSIVPNIEIPEFEKYFHFPVFGSEVFYIENGFLLMTQKVTPEDRNIVVTFTDYYAENPKFIKLNEKIICSITPSNHQCTEIQSASMIKRSNGKIVLSYLQHIQQIQNY